MADPAADVDLDSVIDRLLEGEFVGVCVGRLVVALGEVVGVVWSIGSVEEEEEEEQSKGGGLGDFNGILADGGDLGFCGQTMLETRTTGRFDEAVLVALSRWAVSFLPSGNITWTGVTPRDNRNTSN
jgi:hypothetical protein